jgi:vancomycin permeability regulator SanA
MSDTSTEEHAAEQCATEESQAADGLIRQRPRLIAWLRRTLLTGFMFFALFVGFIWYANFAATSAGKGILFDDVNDVPVQRAGLVFGCSHKLGTRDNLYFKYRIQAAAELWHAGKVDFLIVSGDNREKYYNEPVTMRKALVKAGVPYDRIVCDYAGLRTLDSVVRANKIFGLSELTLSARSFRMSERPILPRPTELPSMATTHETSKATPRVRPRIVRCSPG